MRGMKTSMKTSVKASLIVVALALLACLVWLVSRPGGPGGATGPDASRVPSFEVRVEKPRIDRFLYGVLPIRLEEKLLGGELRFGHASRGAQVGGVAPEPQPRPPRTLTTHYKDNSNHHPRTHKP